MQVPVYYYNNFIYTLKYESQVLCQNTEKTTKQFFNFPWADGFYKVQKLLSYFSYTDFSSFFLTSVLWCLSNHTISLQ